MAVLFTALQRGSLILWRGWRCSPYFSPPFPGSHLLEGGRREGSVGHTDGDRAVHGPQVAVSVEVQEDRYRVVGPVVEPQDGDLLEHRMF